MGRIQAIQLQIIEDNEDEQQTQVHANGSASASVVEIEQQSSQLSQLSSNRKSTISDFYSYGVQTDQNEIRK